MAEKEYAVGLFDGNSRVYSAKHELMQNELLHQGVVTDLTYAYLNQECSLVSSSADQTLHVYECSKPTDLRLAYIGKWYSEPRTGIGPTP